MKGDDRKIVALFLCGGHVKPNTVSRTAQRVALRRAAHQLLDAPPVLADPLALRIIDAGERAALEADPRARRAAPGSIAELRQAGFSRATDVGPDAIHERYFKERRDGLRVSGSMGHMMMAQV